MFLKLFKYDLMFGSRRYGILFILLGGVWLSGLAVSLVNISFLNILFFTLHVFVTVFLLSVYIITSLQFVFGALSGDESYLQYTIPISTAKLLFSKLLCVWCWGAAVAGGLLASWLSLNATLLSKMEITIIFTEDMAVFLASLASSHTLMMGCILLLAVALFNRPGLRRLNANAAAVAVVTYIMTQVAGVLELGVLFLVLRVQKGGWYFLGAGYDIESDLLQMGAARLTPAILPLLLGALFFLFSVRSLQAHRSI